MSISDMPSTAEPHAETLHALASCVGDEAFTVVTFRDVTRVYVEPDQLHCVLSTLKDRRGFNLLSDLGATDYLGYPGVRHGSDARFEVHYVVLNLETSERLVVKVGAEGDKPSIPSMVSLWGGADWMEREVFDLFGIIFEGHPDLRRIVMPDEFTAHPLRKDYPLRGRGERHNFPKISRADS